MNKRKGMSRRDLLKGAALGTVAVAAATAGGSRGLGILVPWGTVGRGALASVQIPQVPLPGRNIIKWVDPLPHFAGARVDGTTPLTVTMEEFQQTVLPSTFVYPAPFTGTWVWGYNVGGAGALYPGFTVEALRGSPTTMTYVNNLPASGSIVQQYITFDQSVHWANPDGLDMMVDNPNPPPMMIGNPAVYVGSPPAVVHLHGGEVPSDYDGGPDQWFTSELLPPPPGHNTKGRGYRSAVPGLSNQAVYVYPNDQDATTLWFHDHTLGATRLNVYAGLAAFYFLRDWTQERPDLPGGPNDATVQEGARTYKPEIEIAIQDRMFDTNGQWFFPDAPPLNPEHPYWIPEFLGDAIVVNGKTWPYFNVEPRRYRFRFLDGSNARFYRMWLENMATATPGPPFWQIGSDGGLLNTPVKLDAADPVTPRFLLMAPGERADIIIDFAGFAGQTLTLRNNARAPFPMGATVDPQTVGQIMQFRVGTVVTGNGGVDPSYNPSTLQSPRLSPIVPLNPAAATKQRQLTLNEVMGMPQTVGGVAYPGGPIEVLVNNTKWAGKRWELVGGTPRLVPRTDFTPDAQGNYLSELPTVGSTEVWDVINLTADAHPIHLHLVQFQLVHRRNFNVNKYTKLYNAAFPGGGYDHMTGQAYPAGVFIPAYGPPGLYNVANAAGALGGNPDITPYLQGAARPPDPNETGWKDTVIMYPGQVTRIVVRWKQQDGTPYPFDATGATKIAYDKDGNLADGPGYVWHCHIVDHEDNEMMRPYKPV